MNDLDVLTSALAMALSGPDASSGLLEDKSVAQKAVDIVMNSAKKGMVSVCSDFADLMKNNARLYESVEALTQENLRLRRQLNDGQPKDRPFRCPECKHCAQLDEASGLAAVNHCEVVSETGPPQVDAIYPADDVEAGVIPSTGANQKRRYQKRTSAASNVPYVPKTIPGKAYPKSPIPASSVWLNYAEARPTKPEVTSLTRSCDSTLFKEQKQSETKTSPCLITEKVLVHEPLRRSLDLEADVSPLNSERPRTASIGDGTETAASESPAGESIDCDSSGIASAAPSPTPSWASLTSQELAQQLNNISAASSSTESGKKLPLGHRLRQELGQTRSDLAEMKSRINQLETFLESSIGATSNTAPLQIDSRSSTIRHPRITLGQPARRPSACVIEIDSIPRLDDAAKPLLARQLLPSTLEEKTTAQQPTTAEPEPQAHSETASKTEDDEKPQQDDDESDREPSDNADYFLV